MCSVVLQTVKILISYVVHVVCLNFSELTSDVYEHFRTSIM